MVDDLVRGELEGFGLKLGLEIEILGFVFSVDFDFDFDGVRDTVVVSIGKVDGEIDWMMIW